MIFLDMDGTLLNSNNEITEESKKILKGLKNQGKIIIIVTGRILNSALNLLSSEFVNYVLANNGSVWYSYQSNRIIYKNTLNQTELISFFQTFINKFEKIYFSTTKWNPFYHLKEIENFLGTKKEIYQVSIDLKEQNIDEMVHKMKSFSPNFEMEVMQDSFSEIKHLTILNKNVNKGKSILAFSKFLNQSLQTAICFGDGLNDLSMFEVCGISVAMDNALPELKERAKYITNSNNQNGIYHFLKNYFQRRSI